MNDTISIKMTLNKAHRLLWLLDTAARTSTAMKWSILRCLRRLKAAELL